MLTSFASFGIHRALDEDSDDLSTSFIGCRLIAKGQISHLYAHDPKSFAEIGPDAPWQAAADEGHYVAYLHPYAPGPRLATALRKAACRFGKAGISLGGASNFGGRASQRQATAVLLRNGA